MNSEAGVYALFCQLITEVANAECVCKHVWMRMSVCDSVGECYECVCMSVYVCVCVLFH